MSNNKDNCYTPGTVPCNQELEKHKLEYVTVCVGFDDLLDITLEANLNQVDFAIVVTSHDDYKTTAVARKHGARVVHTDLFKKNGRNFNKGAAINAGMGHFQFHGWRMHLDADIMLPPNFRRMIFNFEHLDKNTIYGADRVDIIGKKELMDIWMGPDQYRQGCFVGSHGHLRKEMSPRYVDPLRGYVPIGFLQLWNAKTQKQYPWSLGSACHDDVLFAEQWPGSKRDLLKTVYVYHLCSHRPVLAEHWEGKPRKDRFK